MTDRSCHIHDIDTNEMRVIYRTKRYAISRRQSGDAAKKTYGGVFVLLMRMQSNVVLLWILGTIGSIVIFRVEKCG